MCVQCVFFFKQKTAYELPLVTGVQTCALPICNTSAQVAAQPWLDRAAIVRRDGMGAIVTAVMSRFFSDRFIADGPPSLETIRATFLSIAPEGYAACCAAISGVDLLDPLPTLRPPPLLITGRLAAATQIGR